MKKISFILAILLIFMTFPTVNVYAAHDPYIGIEMVAYNEVVGASASFAVDTRGFIKQLRNGAYVIFKDVTFGQNGPTALDLTFGTDATYVGRVEFYLDTIENKPFAQVDTFNSSWAQSVVSTEIEEEITGVHDLIVRPTSGVANLYKVLFYEKQVAGAGVVYKPGDYFEDIKNSPYKNEINMFYEMGAIKGFSETKFEPELFMNRGDFASVMYSLLGNGGVGDVTFADVSVDNANSEAISWMYGAGLVTGDENSLFRPYDFVTPSEAATIAVRALGFEKLALVKGGYPTGYLAVAQQEDLFTNIKPGKYLTREEIAQFLYNFVNADYLDIEYVKSDGVGYVRKNGIMGRDKGIYTGEGVVTATAYTGLKVANSGLGADEVMIDGETYLVGDTAAAGLLGYETTYYYKEVNNKKVLTNLRPSSASIVTTISSGEFSVHTLTENLIEYFDKNGKSYKIRFDDDTAFIYNGKAADKPLRELITAGNFSGKVTHIENKGTDAVLIEQHKTVIIGAVDTFNMVVKNNRFTDSYDFDPYTSDSTLMKDSEPFAFGQLECGMVLSVFESKNSNGKKRVIAYVEQNTITGTVETIEDDIAVINGTDYNTAFCDGTSLRLGLSGTFTLNYLGEIVAFDDANATENVIKPAIYLESDVENNGFDSVAKIRMYTTDGVIGIYSFATKVTADGVLVEKPAEIIDGKGTYLGLDALNVNSLIRYKLNSLGEISMIDTQNPGDGGDFDILRKLNDSATKFYFNETTKAFLDANGKSMYMYDEQPEAFVFAAGSDEEKLVYTATPMDLISAESSAMAEIYTVTNSSIPMVDYFVWSDRITNTEAKYSSPFVFVKKTKKVDENGDPAYTLYGRSSSGEVKYTVTEEFLNDDNNANIKKVITTARPGDALRFRLDLVDNIYSAEVIYLRDGASSYSGITPIIHSASAVKKYDAFQRYRFVYGVISEKEGDIIRVDCTSGDKTSDEYFTCGGATVVDYSASTDKVEYGTTSASLIPGEKVLVCVSSKQIALIVRYKN